MNHIRTKNIKGATLKAFICEIVEFGTYASKTVYVLPEAFEAFYNTVCANNDVFVNIDKVVYEWDFGSKYSESWCKKYTFWNGKFNQIARICVGASETTIFNNPSLY